MNPKHTKFALAGSLATWFGVFLFHPVPDFLTQGLYATPAALVAFILLLLLSMKYGADWSRQTRILVSALVVLTAILASRLVFALLLR